MPTIGQRRTFSGESLTGAPRHVIERFDIIIRQQKGGAVLAEGLLLAVDGNKMLYLIEPDPSGFKPLASAELLEPGENWAPIALVDGKLLIRDQNKLKCLAVPR